MTTFPEIIEEAERLIRELAADLTRVRDGDCLGCYVGRQLDDFSCDGSHRLALRYRDSVAPRATALLDRLSHMGACCCDCEMFANAYQLQRRFWTQRRAVEREGYVEILDPDWPEVLPPCAGVRRGSVQPCTNWVRRRRW